MDPITLAIVIGVGGALIVSLVVYFLVSNKAKTRAAAYREKVNRIVELLHAKIQDLEARVQEAEAAVRDYASHAEEAKTKAEAEGAARASEDFRKTVEKLQREIDKLRRKEAAYEEEASRWRDEATRAAKLQTIAGTGVSVASVRGLMGVVSGSAILRSHRLMPEKALDALDAEHREIKARIKVDIALAVNVVVTVRNLDQLQLGSGPTGSTP